MSVTVATVVAAASGYVILLVAARTLGATEYARFSVFWSLYFALLGILFGVQQEATRSASNSLQNPGTARGPRIVPLSMAIGVAYAAVLAVTAPFWMHTVFKTDAPILTGLIVLAAISYAGQAGSLGALAGSRSWSPFSGILVAEGLSRLAAVLVAAAFAADVIGFAGATAVAALAWLICAVAVPGARRAWNVRSDVESRALIGRIAGTMVAAAASATLVVGFPALLEVTTPGGLGATGGVLVLAVTLTRAPLLIPLNAFQGMAINHFVTHRDKGAGALARPLAAIGLLGALGVLLGATVGPWVMVTMFGREYDISGATLGGLMVAATLIACITLTGSAVIAADRHRAFVLGWIVAAAASAGVLLAHGSLAARAIASLVVGPLVGLTIHLLALRHGTGRSTRDERDS